VAEILAGLGMDTTTLVAALLHDTVEDTSYTMDELAADFGGEVALLVDGVTKFEKSFYGADAEAHTIRKMIVAAGTDVRVLIVKLADRLHNMRTLDARSTSSRVRIARATQEVLIPLCQRLGIQALMRDLEDSVLAAVEPDAHQQLLKWVAHRPEWTAYTDAFMAQVSRVLRSARIRARVVARPHHLHTIWSETIALGREPAELHRIAVIIDGPVNDCYAALGEMHTVWRPVASRFKDFVAAPKNNLYRSLHTTVIGPGSRAVEVQIRTEEMDRDAVYGIVAGFRFRGRRGAHAATRRGSRHQGSVGTVPQPRPDHLDWLRNLVRWQEEAVDPVRFIESLRCDLSEDQVVVFIAGVSEGASQREPDASASSERRRAPQSRATGAPGGERTERQAGLQPWAGRRVLMPAGATPVDAAYALGPDIGDRCIAATVNGQLAFLSSPLADGDVIEIHTQDASGPSVEWLEFVRTPAAQLHIEKRLGLRDDPQTAPPLPLHHRAQIGLKTIRMELHWRERRLGNERLLHEVATALGYPDPHTLCVSVADHVVPAARVAELLIERAEDPRQVPATRRPATAGADDHRGVSLPAGATTATAAP
jgi:GTP pyrophosphokinase